MKAVPYLQEPNYYRIAYQLAAQQMHDDLAPTMSTTPDAAIRTEVPSARRVADELVYHADEVLDWLNRRSRSRWVRLRLMRKLTPSQQRLQAFLDTTIAPGARLLLAGIDLEEGQLPNAEKNANVVRARDVYELSHRALYSLSCYEAQLAAAGQWNAKAAKRCLEALEDALRTVYGHDRGELIRWADKDPSFTAARKRPDFRAGFAALLAAYPAPEENAPTTEPADEPKSLIERIMRLVRRWLGLDRKAP
jgi:hypothetical protein